MDSAGTRSSTPTVQLQSSNRPPRIYSHHTKAPGTPWHLHGSAHVRSAEAGGRHECGVGTRRFERVSRDQRRRQTRRLRVEFYRNGRPAECRRWGAGRLGHRTQSDDHYSRTRRLRVHDRPAVEIAKADYSARSAVAGSIRSARRMGTQWARSATRVRRPAAAAKVGGSTGLTPNMSVPR